MFMVLKFGRLHFCVLKLTLPEIRALQSKLKKEAKIDLSLKGPYVQQ